MDITEEEELLDMRSTKLFALLEVVDRLRKEIDTFIYDEMRPINARLYEIHQMKLAKGNN